MPTMSWLSSDHSPLESASFAKVPLPTLVIVEFTVASPAPEVKLLRSVTVCVIDPHVMMPTTVLVAAGTPLAP